MQALGAQIGMQRSLDKIERFADLLLFHGNLCLKRKIAVQNLLNQGVKTAAVTVDCQKHVQQLDSAVKDICILAV